MYPILEFDDSPTAVIEPSEVLKPIDGLPENCVLCFFQEVIQAICGDGKAEIAGHLVSETGRFPIYVLDVPTPNSNQIMRVTVAHPGVGAPYAGAVMEELIAQGCTRLIACGGAGAINTDITLGHVVVPNAAIRDEGTSYHYLPPSREVTGNTEVIEVIETTLQTHHVPYIVGKTWTTDGIYRETRAKVERRQDEGCLTVEMETATFFAVSQFRGVQFGQLLYGGDDLTDDNWDNRGWQKLTSTREKLFWFAVESVLRLEKSL